MLFFRKEKTKEYLIEVFYFFSKILILSFVLEFFLPGLIITYFNLNIFLFFWILLFIIILGNICFSKK